jgi:hypothetical protein
VVKVPAPVRVVLVVLLVLALLTAAVWMLQRRLIYFPDRSAPPPAGRVIPGGRDVTLHTGDGLRLGAWLVPPRPGTPDRHLAVLVAPAMRATGSLAHHSPRPWPSRVLPCCSLTTAATAATRAARARKPRARCPGGADVPDRASRCPADRLLYYGESLGAAVVTALATKHPPAGLVLRSPFTDLVAAGREHYPLLPVRLLARTASRWPTCSHGSPHPRSSSTAPPTRSFHRRRAWTVAGNAAGPVRLVAVNGADHNDASLLAGEQLVGAVRDLADRIA